MSQNNSNIEIRTSYDGSVCKEKGCNQGGNHYPDKEQFPPSGHGICESYWLRPELCPNKSEHYREKFKDELTFKYSMSREGPTETAYLNKKKLTDTHTCKRCICGLYIIYEPKVKDENQKDH